MPTTLKKQKLFLQVFYLDDRSTNTFANNSKQTWRMFCRHDIELPSIFHY